MNQRHHRFLIALAGSLSALVVAAPNTAQAGFFDQLFGGPQMSRPEMTYEAPRPRDAEPFVLQRHHRVRQVVDEKPVLQQPTDLMHDKTLRPGDAVMTKTGIQIYAGREENTHRTSEFKPLDDARHVKPSERVALASLDVTRHDPLAKAGTPDTIASGRSAAVGSPIVTGVKFTDQRGRTIRYIGP